VNKEKKEKKKEIKDCCFVFRKNQNDGGKRIGGPDTPL